MPRRRVNPLALAVLSCLAQRPMHPYEMATTLREQAHDAAVKLSYGSLYNAVESLRKAGLIDIKGTARHGNRPERTAYEVTEAGQAELVRWLRELLGAPAKEYPLVRAGLTFIAALAPDDALAQLALRAHRLEQEIERDREAWRAALSGGEGRPAVRRLHQLQHEHELTMKEAELDWVRKLVREINDGSLDGIDEWRAAHRD